MNIGELKHRIEIWGNVNNENGLGEIDQTPVKIKPVWASIAPLSGVMMNGQGLTVYAKSSHKFKIRAAAFPDLQIDNWIMYKGLRYNLKDFQQDFKNNQLLEIFADVIRE